MTESIRLIHRFNADVRDVRRDGDRIAIEVADWTPIRFTADSPGLADAVVALRTGATLAELQALCAASDGAARLHHCLERLAFARLLGWELCGLRPIASVTALAGRYMPLLDAVPHGPVSFSRFAYLRRDADRLVVDSASVRARLTVHPATGAALSEVLVGDHRAIPGSLAEALWRLGFMEDGVETEARRSWEFHDLMMHESSRLQREVVPIGATFRFRGVFPSPPARPVRRGRVVALPAADGASVGAGRASLDELQVRRRSIRVQGQSAISFAQLATFLWRVCRTRTDRPAPTDGCIERPYPSGGCLHELEFHVAVTRCDGLDAGLYHYDGSSHVLHAVDGSAGVAGRIAARALDAMAMPAGSQVHDVIVVLTSRLPRLAWKYQGMAYRVSLMNAGVAIGLMYLVATDMGLAACATGTGDSRLFHDATGIDPFEETPIAEFALGGGKQWSG